MSNSLEFEYQSSVLEHYIVNTRRYKNHFINRKKILDELFVNIPAENLTLKGIMNGINRKDSIQKPIIIPYTEVHLSYGNNLIAMVNFLKKSTGQ